MQRARQLLLALSAASLVLVAACSSAEPSTPSPSPSPSASTPAPSATPSTSATPSAKPVTVSKDLSAIKVTGAYGAEPAVEFTAPWAVDQTRAQVLVKGPSGAPVVKTGQSITFNYVGINGRTGKKFDDSFAKGRTPLSLPLDQLVPGFGKGLEGKSEGSRVLLGIPGADGYDSTGGRPDTGINVGDTLIFVVDLVGVEQTGPSGTKVTPAAGLPTVTDAAGVPSVTVPKTAAPTKLVVQPLIKGNGPKVAATDQVTFNYTWYGWDGQKLADTYTGKQVGKAVLSTLVTGVQQGLTGQTVGSRVMIIVPNTYPDGNATPKIDKGEATVFVFDILFTQAPTQ